MKTTVIIKIHYKSAAGMVEQKGEFKLYSRTPQQVALDWWEKDVSRGVEKQLISILCEGADITDLVLEVKKQKLRDLWLPF